MTVHLLRGADWQTECEFPLGKARISTANLDHVTCSDCLARVRPVRPVVARQALIEKLEAELYETEAGYVPTELAYRNGHNDRARSLIAWLKENQ